MLIPVWILILLKTKQILTNNSHQYRQRKIFKPDIVKYHLQAATWCMCRKGSFFVYLDGEMLRSAFSAGSFWHSILFIYQPCMQESNALTASSYLSYIWLSNFFHGTSEDLVISILINFLKKLLPQTWIWFWVAHFVFKTAVGKKQQRHGAKRMEVRCISKTQFYFLARTGNLKGGIMICEKTSWKPVQF